MNGTSGSVHLLTVAISRYSPNQPDVPTAVRSSRDLKQVLNMRAAGDKVIDWGNKTLCGSLENESATKAAILSCLGKIANSVKPSDMVILSLAEHGTTRGNELFYYIPHSDGKEIEGISSAELADVFRKLQARRIIVIVDACDSGAAIAPLQQAILARVATAASLRGKQPDGQSTSDA